MATKIALRLRRHRVVFAVVAAVVAAFGAKFGPVHNAVGFWDGPL